ncbi:hypothetical protein CEUSTIGMA_g10511.t1 [Chlamydomonas eustigma]|uniref:Uncharacterized protein n=1 Tax=Chlamydomonas eustigma TaxID=1157962 RepID=A0A250XJ25_9CHLO|nr:hypothetical protein CEUSTIGMA_g10511.t1 [Chlamydomonas eustigma]|eukprot:GAX83085.1 hypothetical protein CEUSTIGMA_g10511.t1 [Chlamydomonas eustigma]
MVTCAIKFAYFRAERHNEVILAVRGSMSVTNVVTDLMCFPDKVKPSWYQPPNPKGTGAAVGAVSSAVNHGMNKEPSLKTPIMSPPALYEATAAPSEVIIMGRPNSARQASNMASRNSLGIMVLPPSSGPTTSCTGYSGRMKEQPPHIYAHQGILRSRARAVLASIERAGVLRAVLEGDEKEQKRLGHDLYRQDCRYSTAVCKQYIGLAEYVSRPVMNSLLLSYVKSCDCASIF